MDAALDAVLICERDRAPLTALTAAFYAELAFLDGRTDDALRLIDIAHGMASRQFASLGLVANSLPGD